MSINDDYLGIGELLADRLGRPAVTGLYLPAPVADETFRDEFGFVFLEDGSVGPFYVSLGDLLQRLWRSHPEPPAFGADALALLQGFARRDDLPARALALGTYNALSAALYRAAGFEPPDRGAQSAPDEAPPCGRVGMVGYFCPLVDRLTAQGCELVILEMSPERVPDRAGVTTTGDARDLRACSYVLCTASTLVNDSLEGLLAELGPGTRIELIGPSGSGLPDPLFARGVSAVGGISFPDREHLLAQLAQGQPWGSAGRKYQLDAAGYPGLDRLLARLAP